MRARLPEPVMVARTLAVLAATGGAIWPASVLWVRYHARRAARPVRGGPFPALVLGCPPGPALDRRVDRAVGLWRDGHADALVLSGRGEAEVAAARAAAAGVPPAALHVEPRATTTWENLVFARAWVGDAPVWLVSDAWHLPRSTVLARRAGLDARPVGVEAALPALTRARLMAREGLAVVKSLAAGHLGPRRAPLP